MYLRQQAHPAEVEPGLKEAQVLEELREQEVEQTPELAQVVLQGCACIQPADDLSVQRDPLQTL